MDTVLLVFGIVFVAEIGDKSQLIALTLATRHATIRVVAGLVIANVVTQTLSVAAGGLLGSIVEGPVVTALAGVTFLVFAVITLRKPADEEEDDAGPARSAGGVITTVAGSIILAEFGDKTMLVTMALAASQGVGATWLGSVAGMTAAGLLGIAVGHGVGQNLPEQIVRRASAAVFAALGVAFLIAALA